MSGGFQGNSITLKVLKYWLPVTAMLGLMFYFSTDVFSGEQTRGVIEHLVSWFMPGAGRRSIAAFNLYVRKAAHFIEYAVLSILLFRAFRADHSARWRLSWATYSLAAVISWSIVDELHQSFTRRRGASIYDCLLDSAGGFFGLVLIYAISRRRGKR